MSPILPPKVNSPKFGVLVVEVLYGRDCNHRSKSLAVILYVVVGLPLASKKQDVNSLLTTVGFGQ